jgi:ATP-binding cassette subfamily E protein 1
MQLKKKNSPRQHVAILGINIFLDGFVPTENLRFRDESLVFKVAESATEEEVKRMNHYEYPSMTKTMGNFQLHVVRGQFSDSEILVLLGENGTGKTTFIRMLAGNLQADEGSGELPTLHISYKPQKISPKSQGLVRQLLHEKIRDAYIHPQVLFSFWETLDTTSCVAVHGGRDQTLEDRRHHRPRGAELVRW